MSSWFCLWTFFSRACIISLPSSAFKSIYFGFICIPLLTMDIVSSFTDVYKKYFCLFTTVPPTLHRFPFVPFEQLQAREFVTRHCRLDVSESESMCVSAVLFLCMHCGSHSHGLHSLFLCSDLPKLCRGWDGSERKERLWPCINLLPVMFTAIRVY